MPLDPSIIAQAQQFKLDSPLEMASQAMRLKSMKQQNDEADRVAAERNQLQSAYKGATSMGPDGKVNFDRASMLSKLAQENPQLAYQQQQDFEAKDRETSAAKLKEQYDKLGMISQLAGSATDQRTYTAALQQAKSMGLDTSQLPDIYDPSIVRMTQMQALTAKEQLANQIEQQKLADARLAKSDTANQSKAEGFKKVDSEFAKDYDEWTSGGSSAARSEIDKLRGVVGSLKEGKVQTGGFTGMLPDRMTFSSTLGARADVQSTVMNSLRSILGAQFTEKEGERIIKNTWNESDSTKNNIARLERLIGDLESRANEKDAKSQFYEQSGGTLRGYNPVSKRSSLASSPSGKTLKTKDIDWAD